MKAYRWNIRIHLAVKCWLGAVTSFKEIRLEPSWIFFNPQVQIFDWRLIFGNFQSISEQKMFNLKAFLILVWSAVSCNLHWQEVSRPATLVTPNYRECPFPDKIIRPSTWYEIIKQRIYGITLLHSKACCREVNLLKSLAGVFFGALLCEQMA